MLDDDDGVAGVRLPAFVCPDAATLSFISSKYAQLSMDKGRDLTKRFFMTVKGNHRQHATVWRLGR